jgi:hypothetical protein
MEDPHTMFLRGLQLRKFLHYQMQNLRIAKEEKVVIVSHSAFLTSISAKGYD